jgi:hypothetical protein
MMGLAVLGSAGSVLAAGITQEHAQETQAPGQRHKTDDQELVLETIYSIEKRIVILSTIFLYPRLERYCSY